MEIDFVRLDLFWDQLETLSRVYCMGSWLRAPFSMRSHRNMHSTPVSNLCDRVRVSHAHCVSRWQTLDARSKRYNVCSQFVQQVYSFVRAVDLLLFRRMRPHIFDACVMLMRR